MKKVVVIGGGIAGLAAARELARNEFAVTVLEAKNRFGGRIHTVHDGPIPVELGAEFLHGENPAVRRLLEEANLSTETVPDRNRIFTDGKFKETKIWDIVGEVFNRVDPRRPDCSFADFLAMQPVEPEIKRLTQNFVQGFDAADPKRISAHALRRSEYAAEHMAGSTQLRVTAGYSALVEFLLRDLRARGGSAVTGAGVRKVTWRPRRVEVLFEQDGKAETIEADAAVIALPLGVLKTNQVVFEPSLPQKV
ncbi:MAG TPA: FAD-dependent oxidoreductase, partial [Verrucomicrobiae bacterium]|nr:FAD-dependent oxidoreductase [Verrucomicrobiae bacterium]